MVAKGKSVSWQTWLTEEKHFLDRRQLQKQSLKTPASSQQSVRSMLGGRWDGQRADQSSCNQQKCWPGAAEMPCRQMGSVPSWCARGGGRDVALGAGSPVVEWLEIVCWLLAGAIYVLPAYSKAAATHPGRAWSVPSSCTECKCQKWMVASPHSLSPTSGISSCSIWPVLMWWAARFPSCLADFSLSHYSATDRDWALSLSLWNLPLWPPIGRSFQGLHSCTLSVTSLWHQNFTSFSFFSCQLHFMKSALCRAVLPCLHFDDS